MIENFDEGSFSPEIMIKVMIQKLMFIFFLGGGVNMKLEIKLCWGPLCKCFQEYLYEILTYKTF